MKMIDDDRKMTLLPCVYTQCGLENITLTGYVKQAILIILDELHMAKWQQAVAR